MAVCGAETGVDESYDRFIDSSCESRCFKLDLSNPLQNHCPGTHGTPDLASALAAGIPSGRVSHYNEEEAGAAIRALHVIHPK
jgi:hypothetical protein